MSRCSGCFQCILQCLLRSRAHSTSRTLTPSPGQLNQEQGFLCQKYNQQGENQAYSKGDSTHILSDLSCKYGASSFVIAGTCTSNAPVRHLHQAPKFSRMSLSMYLRWVKDVTALEVKCLQGWRHFSKSVCFVIVLFLTWSGTAELVKFLPKEVLCALRDMV